MIIWAATCAEWAGQFPFFIWEEDIEDKDIRHANAYELAQENLARKEEVDKARNAAQNDPESIKARALHQINANIQRTNDHCREIGQRGRLHQKSVIQVFSFDNLTRDYKKNGIDWFLYRQKVCNLYNCFVQL